MHLHWLDLEKIIAWHNLRYIETLNDDQWYITGWWSEPLLSEETDIVYFSDFKKYKTEMYLHDWS